MRFNQQRAPKNRAAKVERVEGIEPSFSWFWLFVKLRDFAHILLRTSV